MEPRRLTPVQLKTQAIFLRYMVENLYERGQHETAKKYRKRLRVTLQELNDRKNNR